MFKNLGLSLPIYTTRPHGQDKETATYSMSFWMTMLAGLLVWLNVIAWGAIGIYEAFRVTF